MIVRLLSLLCFGLVLALSAPNSAYAAELTKVEAKRVCMVNNTLFDKDQIPVEVAGKTYYGCCEMCKSMLKDNHEARVAVDPVSGKQVDKSIAVIGATATGNVFYFESEENLNKFSTR